MANGKFISYLRVSTEGQRESGLGLEAQREAVARHLKGGELTLVAEYVETESGKRSDRPELAKALAEAKKQKATLIVAKLDRLSRSVAFLSRLMESGVDFVAADNPHANKLMVHMLAAFAEHERDQISVRTKAALAAAKARGVALGNRTNLHDAQRKGANTNLKAAASHAVGIAPEMARLRGEGQSLAMIANTLNARGISTRYGAFWTAVQVSRVLKRTGE
ncbi:MAG: recombinase family protein [Oligoflexus sp.]